MSTSIDTAWQVPLNRLDRFIPRLYFHQYIRAYWQYEKAISYVKTDVIKEIYDIYQWDKKMTLSEFTDERGDEILARTALRVCYLASVQGTRDLKYDLDCGFNIWIYNGYGYVIPWGEHKYYENFRNFRSQQADYCYWNGTDTLPKGVTRTEWDKRGRRWQVVMRDSLKLIHQTIKLSDKVGAWTLIDQYLGHGARKMLTLNYDENKHPAYMGKTIRDFMVVT